MALHFDQTEFESRIAAAQAAVRAQGLDGVLLFAPESQYYLCGYDTFGFALFQCMVLPADGELHLLTRAPDLRQAQQTSILSDAQIHIWKDGAEADPFAQLADLLSQLGLRGKRLGIETQTAGLTAFHGKRVEAALAGTELVEASELVRALRRRKSAAEIAHIRRAAALSDDALDAAIAATAAGAFEGDILTAMQGAIFRGGGDYPANEFILGSGDGALLCRYYSGRRHLDARDQLTLEWSGAYRHYHAAMMRTLVIGRADAKQKRMHDAAVAALLACEESVRPGACFGDVFAAHAKALDERDLSHARLNACGYGMGATFGPSWMEPPMFYRDNPLAIEADQVLFMHMILMDSDAGLAMCVGHSVRVTDTGFERLSRHNLDMIEC